jgi:hypothetical protein
MKRRSGKIGKLRLSHYVYGDVLSAAWLVVRDPCAGRKSVYTVYRISLTAFKAAHVIGRELPLTVARDIVRQDRDSLRC